MEKIIELLRESDAMLEGHFLLSSGRHSDKYFQCARLLQYPDKAQTALKPVAEKIADDIKSGKIKVDIVVGPAMGGIIAAWEVARQLSLPAIFTERDDTGTMTVRRFELQPGQNVLIVEDVVTTGKSSMECAAALELAGAKVTALACVVDRRTEDAKDIPWPFYPGVKVSSENWDASECELCKKGIPVVKPGSRKKI
ncbi:MAG: orotate phosphoribosyltransferase [Treponema sp.]|jgi:orotate phosphoribosyltransferase|nr:orotate phosphoribosyltransferase [Treponema sp.]